MTKIGIEIHQRLGTEHKLFCNCSTVESGKKICEIRRKLHPVPSELGEIDIAASFEFLKGKIAKYDVYEDTVCEIDLDESPPLEINKEAVDIVLLFCKMVGADIVDEVQIMRKTVLDGSTPMGFQRTALIGIGGKIKTKSLEVPIQTICLEEESAGIIGELAGRIERYRLDRLGIPLIEIATSADIKNGKEAKEIAERIGLMLRATGKVQRGIGTIRQDLNVSIREGARVEIKGVQDLDNIEKIIDNEILRQKSLVNLCEKMKSEKIKKEGFEAKDVTQLFTGTECKFVKEAIWKGKKVFSTRFQGMKGVFNQELYKGFRFGRELNGYAKIFGVGGIIHSDENMVRYGFSEEIKNMEKELGIKKNDGWIMIVGDKETCEKALLAIFERAYLMYIPEETRNARPDGSTEYTRPLPGAARMYPETDSPPFRITEQMISEIKELPDFEKTKNKIRKILNEGLTDKILRSEHLLLFEEIIKTGVDPTLVAVTLEETLKSLRREGVNVKVIKAEKIMELFEGYKRNLFVKAAISEILKSLAKDPSEKIDRIVKKNNLEKISGFELRELIKKMNAKNIDEVMQKYWLNVDSEEVKEIVKGIIQKTK